MKKQKITIETNGTHKGTKLFIDGHRLYFESLSMAGSKDNDYDILVGLANSKLTQREIQQQCAADAVGFIQDDDEDWDDE